MRLKEVIRAAKTVTKAGKWDTGKMPKMAFPLTKTRGYVLGSQWTWRADVLDAAGDECRLLTAFRLDTQSFLAMLTIRRGDDYVVLARYEHHGTEPGWHIHVICDDSRTGRYHQAAWREASPAGEETSPPQLGCHERKLGAEFVL